MKLVEFPLSQLEEWLPNIWAMLKEACETSGKYEPMDIVRELAAKRMQLWNAVEDNVIHAIGITKIDLYPRAKVCWVLAITGKNMELWTQLLPKLEEWAKEIGCTEISPVCRTGWEKILKPSGYKKDHLIMRKKL